MILEWAPDPDFEHNDPDFISVPFAHIVPGTIDLTLFKAKDINYENGPNIVLPEHEKDFKALKMTEDLKKLEEKLAQPIALANLSHYSDLFSMRIPVDPKNQPVATASLLSDRRFR